MITNHVSTGFWPNDHSRCGLEQERRLGYEKALKFQMSRFEI